MHTVMASVETQWGAIVFCALRAHLLSMVVLRTLHIVFMLLEEAEAVPCRTGITTPRASEHTHAHACSTSRRQQTNGGQRAHQALTTTHARILNSSMQSIILEDVRLRSLLVLLSLDGIPQRTHLVPSRLASAAPPLCLRRH